MKNRNEKTLKALATTLPITPSAPPARVSTTDCTVSAEMPSWEATRPGSMVRPHSA